MLNSWRVGIGLIRWCASCSKVDGPVTDTVRETNREVCGTRDANGRESERGNWTSRGTDLDRSRYVLNNFSFEQAILLHTRGKDSNAVRQYRQTAVALINRRPGSKNVAMRARISGGSLLMGAKEFLMFSAFLWMPEILDIT